MQYRVTARDQDSGQQSIIYEGFRRECRLPADLRLSPNQLAYRVEAREPDDDNSPYQRCQEMTLIPRIGDEVEDGAADILRALVRPGASSFRLQIQDAATSERIVDMQSDSPRFMLPAGLLVDRETVWDIRSKVGERWRRGRSQPVTADMIGAARLRAERMIEVVDAERSRAPVDAVAYPAHLGVDLPQAPAQTIGLMIAVPVTARPQLAVDPTAESVLSVQWSDGQGGGAVERTAVMLEERGLTGSFFIDIEQGLALDADRMATLGRRLLDAGHTVGLYIGQGELAPPGQKLAARLKRMLASLAAISPGRTPGVMVGAGKGRLAWLKLLENSGFAAAIVSRGAQTTMPGWTRWRTVAFPLTSRLVVHPTTMFMSTPAHARDRVTRTSLDNRDAVAAGSARQAIEALEQAGDGPRLLVAEIDPLLILDYRRVKSAPLASGWNSALAEHQPLWLKAGWKRSPKQFQVAHGISLIQMQLVSGLLKGLAQSGQAAADWDAVFAPERASGWLPENPAYDPVVEMRRGPRRFRATAVRRYDNAYRLALCAATGAKA